MLSVTSVRVVTFFLSRDSHDLNHCTNFWFCGTIVESLFCIVVNCFSCGGNICTKFVEYARVHVKFVAVLGCCM